MIVLILEESEKDLTEVKSLCDFIESKKMNWSFIKHPSQHSYRELEQQIENSKLAICILGSGVMDTTWVNVCIQYCWALKKYRQSDYFNYLGLKIDASYRDNPSSNNFNDNSSILSLEEIFNEIEKVWLK